MGVKLRNLHFMGFWCSRWRRISHQWLRAAFFLLSMDRRFQIFGERTRKLRGFLPFFQCGIVLEYGSSGLGPGFWIWYFVYTAQRRKKELLLEVTYRFQIFWGLCPCVTVLGRILRVYLVSWGRLLLPMNGVCHWFFHQWGGMACRSSTGFYQQRKSLQVFFGCVIVQPGKNCSWMMLICVWVSRTMEIGSKNFLPQ